jgi:hypothetical protein
MASLPQKNELALQAYLKTFDEFKTVNIFTGISSFEKEGPAIIISADKGHEDPLTSGNYRIHVNVSAKWTAETEASEISGFRELCGNLELAMKAPGLDLILSAQIEGFTVLGWTDKGPSESVNAGAWVDGHDYESYSCASDIPD